ncbi:MAG: aldo/keto reductase [Bryobacteraceae bacterium]|nr:aldo/keto reductase [Bryobacteraceae bacterium]
MLHGQATADGTARYAARFSPSGSRGFYRQAGEWMVSSLGIGTYLGGMDDGASRGYLEAIRAALGGGVNFIDTSLNYRHQRSERDIGAAIQEQAQAGALARDEFVVCTKAGYLVPNAVPKDLLREPDVAGGMHSMAPAFLADQLERSRRNLGLQTVDVFYLHNPETQREFFPEDEVYARFLAAFRALEEFVAGGRIGCYGAATWQGFRSPPSSGRALSLTRLADIARQAGGDGHHFRFIQLPFNLAMPEAFTEKNERIGGRPATVLEAAVELGITVVASATLLQSRLARDLPEALEELLPGARTDAQRAIQFTRSTPGVAVALVGMGNPAHVKENLEVASLEPATADAYARLFR